MPRVLAFILSLFMCVASWQEAFGRSEPLRIGLTGKYPPFNYFGADGKLVGFDVDIARALCIRLQRPCEFKILQWDGILSALLSGRIDAVIGSMAVTEERGQVVRFTLPYYLSGAQLFVPSTSRPEPERPGFRIGVTLGTTYGVFARQRYPKAEIRTYKGDVEVLQDLQANRIDAMITDKLVGLYMKKSREADIKPLGGLLFEERIAIPVRPSDQSLLGNLNTELKALKASPEYAALNEKYFGEQPVSTNQTWNLPAMARLLLRGLLDTLLISFEGIGLGILLSALLTLITLSFGGWIGKALAVAVDFVRATPFMVQLFALYFGLPSIGIRMSAWNAAILAIAVHSAAYLTEIAKTAYLAVPSGQRWAAKSLGLSSWESLRHVVFPQMLPLLTAPTLNTVVAMIKDSAIVSVISVHELTLQAQELISATFRPLELYAAVAVLYFCVTYPLLILGRRLERAYARKGLLHVP